MMLAPFEKAKELVDKFYEIGTVSEYEAIKCALITVREILQASPENFHPSEGFEDLLAFPDRTHVDAEKYWMKVKEEIEKL
jgi:hypothetical protein